MCGKTASKHTAQANREILDLLNFGDKQDFEDVTRGFVAELDDSCILQDKGGISYDIKQYSFIEGESPDSVNPSLWRQEKLNSIAGLFTIHPKIHQVRNYDISNMTLIEGEKGWIIIDPLLSVETARACLALANKHLGERPVTAVIYTHSHADHFGGVRGVISDEDVASGKVQIIAPNGFMDYAISENVLAGNAMNRRAQYQFGMKLKPGKTGHVGCGLGKAASKGTISLIPPTDIISETGETRVVDGVNIEFQMAMGSEAPSEFMFYFPDFRAMCASEVTSHNMHNILTPRGAEARNSLHWSKYIDETLENYGDRVDLLFASHHWPTWGKEAIGSFLSRQSDVYRFIHDETLRLANHGHTIHEIPDMLELPEGLAHDFACRGYYGTLRHNIKAVYQFYLGWWDCNPATYNELPPSESGQRLVKAMGGPENVISEGRRAFDEGDYRWAAELVNKLVFAEPENTTAKELQADILEQLGYQSEAGTWRNIYLTGTQELRNGVDLGEGVNSHGPDIITAMGIPMALDLLGVKFNPQSEGVQDISIALDFTDTKDVFSLETRNGVLSNYKGRRLENPDVKLTLTEMTFYRLLGKMATFEELVSEGVLSVEGEAALLLQLFGWLDDFDPNFSIVTP